MAIQFQSYNPTTRKFNSGPQFQPTSRSYGNPDERTSTEAAMNENPDRENSQGPAALPVALPQSQDRPSSPRVDSSMAAPASPNDVARQDGAVQNIVHQQVIQSDKAPGPLRARQEDLHGAPNLAKDADQATSSTPHHEALDPALRGVDADQHSPVPMSLANAQSWASERHTLQRRHSVLSSSQCEDNKHITNTTGEVMASQDTDICDGVLATTKTTPPEQIQPATKVPDGEIEYEIDGERELEGKEFIDGVLHYMVPWKSTLVPASDMRNCKELIDRFEAKYGTQIAKFRIVDVVNRHSISKDDIVYLNRHGYFGRAPFVTSMPEFDIVFEPGRKLQPAELFKYPFTVEVVGAGFDKPANAAHFTLRFPRVLKVHEDRSFKDVISFAELQEIATKCQGTPDDLRREEESWLRRLRTGGHLGGRSRKSRSGSLSSPANGYVNKQGTSDRDEGTTTRSLHQGNTSFRSLKRKISPEEVLAGSSILKRAKQD
ncbi:unnamed protein product [Clonostachys solani]|uniref:Uncharacterized protein n=1 Tax=Clonostachys solani TaxID=160281 RepID=A0A9N9ZI77_9HYPO|nr:unnamed protein product [Clonostachys solani]